MLHFTNTSTLQIKLELHVNRFLLKFNLFVKNYISKISIKYTIIQKKAVKTFYNLWIYFEPNKFSKVIICIFSHTVKNVFANLLF